MENNNSKKVLIKKLKKELTFNGIKINTIWVDLDHINRGLTKLEVERSS